MGAKIDLAEGYVTATAPDGLKGAEIVFPFVSVGATETAHDGGDPGQGHHRDRQCRARAGDRRSGQLPDRHGREDLRAWAPARSRSKASRSCTAPTIAVMPDRIEAGTYAIAAAIAGGEVELVGASPRNHRLAAVAAGARAAPRSRDTPRGLKVRMNGARPHAVDVTTAPYPGFPTDLQAQIMALMTVADGTSVIREKIFENRFMHVPELARMGAQVRIDGDTATVRGRGKAARARR